MKYIVAVGSYNIIRVSKSKIQGDFSKQVQDLLDDGWQLRGELHTSTDFVKKAGILSIYVTLVQNLIKEE